VSKSWDGNTSDTQIFQERAQAFISGLRTAPSPRYLLADAKRSTEDNAGRCFHFEKKMRFPISPAVTRISPRSRP
jgi:hypothetical protein